ncbi:MAG TPA: hypothetical protein VG456_18635 [Candidatus Sulfopaludibacter sp.]|jgi:chromosome segregation ATPase|nr:hypothetical protein [Candidatus Sulfopaludibacter sp.]
MSDFESQIRQLKEKTETNRLQFLRTELVTCSIAVDRARYEQSLGDTDEAAKELATASRGAEVIEKFLAEAPSPHPEIESALKELKKSLESLRSDLNG